MEEGVEVAGTAGGGDTGAGRLAGTGTGTAAGDRPVLTVAGVGDRATIAVPVDGSSTLVVARSGDPFDSDEALLLRGMGRVLGQALRMLRALDNERALATLTDGGTTVSLVFRFSENGEIASACAPDRFYEVGGEYRPMTWAGRVWGYEDRGGMMVPMGLRAVGPVPGNRPAGLARVGLP